jgi:hypothetical protein
MQLAGCRSAALGVNVWMQTAAACTVSRGGMHSLVKLDSQLALARLTGYLSAAHETSSLCMLSTVTESAFRKACKR